MFTWFTLPTDVAYSAGMLIGQAWQWSLYCVGVKLNSRIMCSLSFNGLKETVLLGLLGLSDKLYEMEEKISLVEVASLILLQRRQKRVNYAYLVATPILSMDINVL